MSHHSNIRKLSDLIQRQKELESSDENDYEKKLFSNLDKNRLQTPLKELILSIRVIHVLENIGLKNVEDVLLFGFNDLLRKRNFGAISLKELETTLENFLELDQIKETPIEKEENILDVIEESREEKESTSENVSYKRTLEETMIEHIDKKILGTPLDEFVFSARVSNALSRHELRTVGDILSFGWHKIYRIKNIGTKSVNELKNTIEHFLQESQTEKIHIEEEQKTFTDNADDRIFNSVIEDIFSSFLSEKQLQIIKARYGYDDGKKKTLEQIGNKISLTRERVRQVIVKELGRIKHPSKRKVLQTIIENIERLLLQYKGIISINDITKDKYFVSGTRNQLRFLINLIAELYEERYRIIDKYFLTSLSDDEINGLQSKIREAALKCKFPIDEKTFVERIISFVSPISKDYLSYHLLYKEHIEISRGKVLSPGRLSIPQQVKLIMRDVNRPMHFTGIAKLYRNHFGDIKIRTKDLERAIHTRVSDSKEFIIVDAGTFMLREKFGIPVNIKEIVKASKEILKSLKSISDTRYLINELKKREIDIGSLNVYSLKAILLEHKGFISYRKFEIGIEELLDKYERKPLSDLIYEIMLSTAKPMHAKSIWKEISKRRGFPKYTIEQRLTDDPRFIRVAPATYTVAKNITQYEEKQKIIIDFAKEWINLKRNAISAFLISEVLKETKEDKDLSLWLVEHVLNTSPEFIRLPNGFYDLADKEKMVNTTSIFATNHI